LISESWATARLLLFWKPLSACTRSGICSSRACEDPTSCCCEEWLRLVLLDCCPALISCVPVATPCLAACCQITMINRMHSQTSYKPLPQLPHLRLS
jgi:hypothetical protein